MTINERKIGTHSVFEIKDFDPVSNGWDEIYKFCDLIKSVPHRSFSIEWGPGAAHSLQGSSQVDKYLEGFWAGVQIFWKDIISYEELKSRKKKKKRRRKKS